MKFQLADPPEAVGRHAGAAGGGGGAPAGAERGEAEGGAGDDGAGAARADAVGVGDAARGALLGHAGEAAAAAAGDARQAQGEAQEARHDPPQAAGTTWPLNGKNLVACVFDLLCSQSSIQARAQAQGPLAIKSQHNLQ